MAQGKKHVPTKARRFKAKTMAMAGCSEALIATVLDISRPTLRKHYATELKVAKGELKQLAGASLVRLVKQGCFPAVKLILQRDDPSWSDRQDVRHSGAIAHEGPVIFEVPNDGSGDGG